MKRILPSTLLFGAFMQGAYAQGPAAGPSVSIYGLLDAGVEHLTPVSGGGSLTREPGLTGSLPSRLGFRGSEDLGGGLAAIFTLETGIGIDTGTQNQGGRAFGRQAWVGLSGSAGAVTFGRNYTMLYWSLWDGDQLGPAAFGLSSLDSYLPNTRVDNSVAYRGVFGPWTLGATYSFGRDAVNAGPSPSGTNCAGESATDRLACREWSAMVKYDTPSGGMAAAYDELRGGAGAFGGLVRSDLRDRRATLNGYLRVGIPYKLVAGVIRRDNDAFGPASATNGTTPRSNLFWVGAGWSPVATWSLDGQIQRLGFTDEGDKSTLGVVRAVYNLSRRTAVYAQLARVVNGPRLAYSVSSAQVGGTPAAGVNQSGWIVGMRHSF